jgi:DNA-binding MarR family transcriptional regulator
VSHHCSNAAATAATASGTSAEIADVTGNHPAAQGALGWSLPEWVVSRSMSSDAQPDLLAQAERLVLQMASLGTGVSTAIASATGQPDLVGNAPMQVMSLLDLDGPARPSAIADVVGLTSGGTTKLLDRLEAAGMIKRSYGVIDGDHRGVLVTLTSDGRQMVRTAAQAMVDHLPDASDLVKSVVDLLDSLRAT